MNVAVLFARADSVYKTMSECDVYDEARDARTFGGGMPVVAHPPCARWSMLNAVVLKKYAHKAEQYAWGNDGGLFEFALAAVRANGGVLEHPAYSRAFAHYGLPRIGRGPDSWGGWSCEVRQADWGHRAAKRTWLHIVGVGPDDCPPLPAWREATAVVSWMPDCKLAEYMGRAEKERTPLAFARWLVAVAQASAQVPA